MVRNRYELKLIRESGKIATSALKKALQSVKVGISGLELDKIAQDEIYRLGGQLSYKTVPGYQFATCVTVNEQVVHGIPTGQKFEEGDLVSIDLAVEYRGWHTDCAWSVLVRGKGKGERGKSGKEKFLQIGEQALGEGIEQAVEGNRVGDISSAIQSRVEGAGYSVVRALVGHGIGKKLHEEPEIPGYGQKGTGMILKSGMALAIEVIYAKGTPEVILQKDGWTYAAADGSWGGLFEMTVIAGKEKAEVLTYNL
ncbi:MAG: Methionine aminopeptidase [Microgenomates group bacterium Gr01-1014_7]|nr:MAG: Methionine aminopeptidase [Microgenomates group bacterium Gr01-1014_7]